VGTYSAPTAGAVGPGGTLYIAERGGTVRPLRTTGAGPVVLDISGEVSTGGEGGLLGLAFAADGQELYLSYTDRAGDSVIAAVEVRDGAIQPGQRRTLLRVPQPASNHNGGDVRVGPDGMLYVALGDGGGAGDPFRNGQDLRTLLGSVLRIDPTGASPYAVPDDNPFVVRGDARPEIYVYGLRNPWRFSFDRATGDLWIADVGQSAREEVNRLRPGEAAGANLGWNRMEGTLPYDGGTPPPDHVGPVYEYATRSALGCSITGGAVYRGRAIPELVGAYLFSDYCVSSVRGLVVGPDGAVVAQRDLGIRGSSIVGFVENAGGELYVLELSGAVKRIDPA
jgi:glucose/arabinose dehydrogenase